MDYVAKHSSALAKVRDAGVLVSFDTVTPGVYDPTTDTQDPPVRSSVEGYAVEIPGDPEEYKALELIPAHPITLMFVPNVLGETPVIGSTITWAGELRTVNQQFPIRPAELTIASRVIAI